MRRIKIFKQGYKNWTNLPGAKITVKIGKC
jgi:hypothetical protein